MHTAYVSVRLGLLALLDDADMYGYQLKSVFEARTGGVWPLNIGQVYTTLGRLERDGLVASSERPDSGSTDTEEGADERQHRYSITADGRRRSGRLVRRHPHRRAAAPRRADRQGPPRRRRWDRAWRSTW